LSIVTCLLVVFSIHERQVWKFFLFLLFLTDSVKVIIAFCASCLRCKSF
jgi:hypothetical protein